MTGEAQQASAALICPDQGLAQAWRAAAGDQPHLLLAVESASYPDEAELEAMLRGRELDAVLVDVGSDRARALALVRTLLDRFPESSVVGLARANDPETILQCLRAGASEFLSIPFPPSDVRQAVQRILKRRAIEARASPVRRGKLYAFAPAKGGSGATTIATAVAYRIQRETQSKVLLADLNLAAGILAFLLRIRSQYNAIDALRHAGQLDEALWKSLIATHEGVDVLIAPERPEPSLIEPYPAQQLLDFARTIYDHVIIDLGSIVEGVAMTAISAADHVHPVCGTDMPALFLMRRTIPLLEEMGRSRDQIHVLVNRVSRRQDISIEDMEKIFRAGVAATFPDDPWAVTKAQRAGVAIADNTDLGRAVRTFVGRLVGVKRESSPGALGSLRQLLGGA